MKELPKDKLASIAGSHEATASPVDPAAVLWTSGQSERALGEFCDSAGVGLSWVAPDGTILWANRAELRMLGYAEDEYVGRQLTSFHLDPGTIRSVLERLALGELVDGIAARVRCRDGSARDVLINASAMRQNGSLVHSRLLTLDVTESRWAEGSRELAAAIVAQSDDAIVSKRLDGTILSWNPAAERLFGYPAREAIGRKIHLIIPDERRGEEAEILRRLRHGEHIDHFETVRVTRDGRRIDVSLTVSPVRNAEGRIVGASKIARDITEKRRTEQALQASEERYRALVETQAELLCRFRPDGTILYVNPAYAQSLGTTPEALLEGNFWNFVPASEHAAVRGMLNRLTPEAPEVRIENRFNTAEGERWLLWTNRALAFDAAGRLTEAQSMGIDITERKRAEEALRESEGRFKELANNIDQFAWTCDELGQATWYNRRWYEYTGTSFETMQGDGWRAVHHPDHVDRVQQSLMRAVRTLEPWEETFPLRGRDGQYRWFLSRAVPIRDADGRVIRWFGTNTDITELRNLSQALRDADRRKDEFLATLSHELRNPLAPIANSLEVLRQADDDPSLRHEAREAIARQVSHLVRLVDDLLDVSRITRDRLELRRSEVELGTLVRQAVEQRRALPDMEARRIECRVPGQPVFLDADPVRLAQILNNLLNNACKFSPPDGLIEVTAALQSGEAVVSVRDYGAGIRRDRLDRIFDMFTHYDPPRGGGAVAATGGLGIGLTLVKRLVELHGGTIVVQSEGPDQGSKFTFRLPGARTGQAAASAGQRAPAIAPGAPALRILVVDDNVDNARSLSMLLGLKGHDTELALDGEAALRAAEAFAPDVVLLDIGLPGMNGIEVCRKIREADWGRAMTVVAVTGWGQDEDRRRSLEAGFDHHLVKPIEYPALEAVLSSRAGD